jgi:hypothetical protein
MFISFPEALSFAKHEDDEHAHAIVVVPWPLELTFNPLLARHADSEDARTRAASSAR